MDHNIIAISPTVLGLGGRSIGLSNAWSQVRFPHMVIFFYFYFFVSRICDNSLIRIKVGKIWLPISSYHLHGFKVADLVVVYEYDYSFFLS